MAILEIERPVSGRMIRYVHSTDTLFFHFDVECAIYNRYIDHLVLTFEDQSELTLVDFFVSGVEGVLPTVLLSNGIEISAIDFLFSIESRFDILSSVLVA